MGTRTITSRNWTRLGFFGGIGALLTGTGLIFLPLFISGSTPIWLWWLCYGIGSTTAILGGLVADVALFCAVWSRILQVLRPASAERPTGSAARFLKQPL